MCLQGRTGGGDLQMRLPQVVQLSELASALRVRELRVPLRAGLREAGTTALRGRGNISLEHVVHGSATPVGASQWSFFTGGRTFASGSRGYTPVADYLRGSGKEKTGMHSLHPGFFF